MLKTYLFLTICALALVSCSSNDEPVFVPEQDTDFAIVPSSGLGHISGNSRAVIRPAEDTNLGVSVFRVNQTAVDTYPSDYSTATGPFAADLQGNTTSTGTSATINFITSDKQYYLSDGRKTKVIAVYPAVTSASWTASSASVAYAIDGKTDIMATALGEGYKNLAVNPAVAVQPTGMNFNHLLTQIHVRVYAEDANAAAYWGDVKSISVNGRETSCTVILPGIATTAYPTLSTASASTGALALTQEDGTPAATLPSANIGFTNSTENPATTFGYSMFAPIGTAIALPLTIVTEKSSVQATTNIAVASQTYVAGTAYIITLKLTSLNIIPQAVTIAPWASQTVDEIAI